MFQMSHGMYVCMYVSNVPWWAQDTKRLPDGSFSLNTSVYLGRP